MKPIDLIYRFDPVNPDVKALPASADEARRLLEDGNRRFARWTDACLQAYSSNGEPPSYVVSCGSADLGIPTPEGLAGKQAPYAILLGCSDARVPAEIIFSQLRNNLFVVRVAGNVLSDECFGSIEYAVHHMADSIRIIVVLGHTSCGAVTAAVDTYLKPWAYLAKVPSPALRSIVDRLFVPVRKAANSLEAHLGTDAPQKPGYREALVETAVAVNTMQSAYNLRQELEREGKTEIKVVYGIFDLVTHRVWTAPQGDSKATIRDVILADAPATLAEFEELSGRLAARAVRHAARKT